MIIVIVEKDPCEDQASTQLDKSEICVKCIMNDLEMWHNTFEMFT